MTLNADHSDKSFWLATCGPYTLDPPVEVDIAIVGGGFTGLSTAYHPPRNEPGMRVAVLLLATRAPALSGAIGLFLCGAFAFDLLTTWPLAMPIPPGFAVWGSIGLALGLVASVALLRAATPDSIP